MNYDLLPRVSTASLPRNYEAAKQAISALVTIDECKDWADKAAALASYAKQAQDDELERQCQRVRARAVRRQGELLHQIETAQGERNELQLNALKGQKLTRSDAAKDAGISPKQMRTAVSIAAVPVEDFKRQVESTKPPTLTQLAAQGIKPRPLVDHKGRDPREFNRALHFIGTFENYARELDRLNVDGELTVLIEKERASLRGFINRIDVIHDRIMTRI